MEMKQITREWLAFLREQYPVGSRIRLNSMEDPYAPVEPGTMGTLQRIDDAGQFLMKWDNGRTLSLIPGEDSFSLILPEPTMMKLYMPLHADLYTKDDWSDTSEEPEMLTGRALMEYEDSILIALIKNRMSEEAERQIPDPGRIHPLRLWRKYSRTPVWQTDPSPDHGGRNPCQPSHHWLKD